MRFLHISTDYLGPQVTFHPRVPLCASVSEDRTSPRICVAATVELCLKGLTFLRTEHVMYVYQAIQPESIDWDSPRRLVPDWEVSEEVWITQPCRFKFLYPIYVLRDHENCEVKYRRAGRIGKALQRLSVAIESGESDLDSACWEVKLSMDADDADAVVEALRSQYLSLQMNT